MAVTLYRQAARTRIYRIGITAEGTTYGSADQARDAPIHRTPPERSRTVTESYSVGPPSDPAMWGPLEEPLAAHWDRGFCGEALDLDLRACADAPTCVEVVEASCGSCNRRWRPTAAPEQVAEARRALLTRILEAGHAASRSVPVLTRSSTTGSPWASAMNN